MGKGCGSEELDIVTIMREHITTTRSGDMGSILGQLAMCTRETTRLISGMAMGKCTGKMVATIKGTGLMVSNTAKVCVF
jgi:hypothetical protein